MNSETTAIKAVLFDYGGVLAEEGFREGLKAIALKNGLDPAGFYNFGLETMWGSEYVTGRASESTYWEEMRPSGISGTAEELTKEILDRFLLRPQMILVVRGLRRRGIRAAILSDQTDWLERLNARDHFFEEFEQIFNSYYLGKTKKDPSIFSDVACHLGLRPEEILFIDDSPGNIQRARMVGLRTILYVSYESFIADLRLCLGFDPEQDGELSFRAS